MILEPWRPLCSSSCQQSLNETTKQLCKLELQPNVPNQPRHPHTKTFDHFITYLHLLQYFMNQPIRDHHKMMPVACTLSETHPAFPTSSPPAMDFHSKILSGQKRRLPNPFWCPGLFSLCNDTWRHKEAQTVATGYPALPWEFINVWTALIYPGILTSPSATSTTKISYISVY